MYKYRLHHTCAWHSDESDWSARGYCAYSLLSVSYTHLSDLLVRYLYEADLKVYYLNKYIGKMRMGGLSTEAGKSKLKWAEDLRMYKRHGIKPISALKGKILSKIPQFIDCLLYTSRCV